jgi:FeS assembly SUF system regulator
MLQLSKIADYAVVVMLELCVPDSDRLHTARTLSIQTTLPLPTVEKVLKQLKKAGLLDSQRGLCGGYRLNRRPIDISLLQIIEAIEGPVSLTTCSLPEAINCSTHSVCRVGPHWPLINQSIAKVLHGLKLSALLHAPTLSPSYRT